MALLTVRAAFSFTTLRGSRFRIETRLTSEGNPTATLNATKNRAGLPCPIQSPAARLTLSAMTCKLKRARR